MANEVTMTTNVLFLNTEDVDGLLFSNWSLVVVMAKWFIIMGPQSCALEISCKHYTDAIFASQINVQIFKLHV